MAQIIQFPIKAQPSCCVLDCGDPATCYIEVEGATVVDGDLVFVGATMRKYYCDGCVPRTIESDA